MGGKGYASCGLQYHYTLWLRYHYILRLRGGRVKTPDINNKKLVVRSYMDVQRVFVFLQKRAL